MTQPFGRHAANTSYSDCEAAPAAGNLSHSDPGLSAVSHQQMAAVRGKKAPRHAEQGSDPQKAPCDPPPPPLLHPSYWYLQVPASGVPSVASPASIYGHSRQDSRGGQHQHTWCQAVTIPTQQSTAAGSDTARTGH